MTTMCYPYVRSDARRARQTSRTPSTLPAISHKPASSTRSLLTAFPAEGKELTITFPNGSPSFGTLISYINGVLNGKNTRYWNDGNIRDELIYKELAVIWLVIILFGILIVPFKYTNSLFSFTDNDL